MKALISLIMLFVAGTAGAQAPKTASAPATIASAARRYEKIAEKKLPGLQAARPTDFTISKWCHKHIAAKGWKKVLPYLLPVSGDIRSTGKFHVCMMGD